MKKTSMRALYLASLFTAAVLMWSCTPKHSDPTEKKTMTLDSFAQTTIEVIKDDGILVYLPTISLPQTKEFRVIEGIPADVDHTTAIQNVIHRSGYEDKEFFFGVRSEPEVITVGHYQPGQPTSFMQITKTGQGYSAKQTVKQAWWKLP